MVDPAGDGVLLLHVTIAMLTLSWVTLGARLAVRKWLKPEAMGADDYLMFTGLILYSVTCSLVIVCCFYGAGQLSKELTPPDIMQGTKLFFIAEFFYSSCTVPIKSSICVTLLRIADARRRFVWTIWFVIGATAVASVVFILVIANICHPITALWGETTGVCNPILNSSVSFFFSAVSIVTDLTLAVLPAILLMPLQMRWRVKISVVLMLGLAAFASCATIIRLRYLTLYNDQAEFMFSTGQIGLWSVVEEGIGICAGSMPTLRPLLSLSIFGGSTNASDDPSRGTLPLSSSNHLKQGEQRDAVKMQTMRSPRENKGRGSTDDDSLKHILKETQVTVTAETYHAGDDQWSRNQVTGWDSRVSR
ncbi:cation-transporting atpase 4 [Diaporthe amygdali]|uniref:cation-transporting atpase 4 n=1 Tax=Phomopsis amygdali TaxID=1214568 RepID=UPI0022FEEC3A|nr:cation-transporting atpase 4 [Diaporthe amygdali]KAJ0121927.1 cation-transporting atpase 4 [Diaporthe amygdali]